MVSVQSIILFWIRIGLLFVHIVDDDFVVAIDVDKSHYP